MSLASKLCLPRAEWHFLGTIWDCNDRRGKKIFSFVAALLSSILLSFSHPFTNFSGPECCSNCLVTFHSVTGQKTWSTSKSLVALQRGVKWMKMWLSSTKKTLLTGKYRAAAAQVHSNFNNIFVFVIKSLSLLLQITNHSFYTIINSRKWKYKF